MLFFAKNMHDMVSYVGRITTSVESMSKEMTSISQNINTMDYTMKSIDKSTQAIDNNMLLMNEDLHRIQTRIAGDIGTMSKSVKKMNTNVHDMNKGIKVFTSPAGFMNMFRK